MYSKSSLLRIYRNSKWVALFVVILFTSCSDDFLDKFPYNAIASDEFYSNQQELEQGINAAYGSLRDVYGSAWIMGEMRSDNTHFIFDPSDRGTAPLENIPDFLNDAGNGYTASKYYANYGLINDVNQVLARIDNVELSQEVYDNLKGQALFLRAFAYFDLVKYFGGVPIYLAPVTNANSAFVNRSTIEETYAQILEDANEAAQLLPGVNEQQEGRVTNGTANMLLGDIYMNLKRYGEAEAALKKISGYSLVPNYADIFNTKNTQESLFEVQYLQNQLSNNFFYRFLPKMDNTALVTGVDGRFNGGQNAMNVATPDLIDSYEEGDTRFEASIGFVDASTVSLANYSVEEFPYCKKYLIPHTVYNDVGANWPIYRYAETLLYLAEAINEQGGRSGEVLPLINQVRDRARESAGLLPAITTTDQQELREIIAHERKVEFAFENKRWIDLIRTGRAVQVMNAYGQRLKANPEDYYYSVGDAPLSSAYMVTTDDLLFPIPQRERDVYPELEQNPGYE